MSDTDLEVVAVLLLTRQNCNCFPSTTVQMTAYTDKCWAFKKKGSAFNAEVLLGVVNHGLMISFITLTCTEDGQQLNKQYDHNDFQVDVPDSIGVSKFTWACMCDLLHLWLFI